MCVAGALLLSLPAAREAWLAAAYVDIDVELRASAPVRVKLYWDRGAGWEPAGSWRLLVGDGEFRAQRFPLPHELVRGVGVATATPVGLEARGARLVRPGTAPVALAFTTAAAPPEAPAQLEAGFGAPAAPVLQAQLSSPVDASVPLVPALAAWLRAFLPALALRLLGLAVLVVLGSRALVGVWRFLMSHSGRVALLGATCVLVLLLARVSRFNSHPDEALHARTTQFFVEHWLPPSLLDPEIPAYMEASYGYSYLATQPPQVVYLLAGKLAAVVTSAASLADWTRVLRLLAVAMLLALAMLVAARRNSDPAFTLFLVITPQLWYVLGYLNGDGFPFFVSFLVALELGRPTSSASAFFAAPRLGAAWKRALPLGMLLGLLLLSKLNYAPFLLFIAGYALWDVVVGGEEPKGRRLAKWAFVAGVAAVTVLPFWAPDVARNGLHKTALMEQLRETYAAPAFKPSRVLEPDAYPGLALDQRGVPLRDLFSKMRWHVTAFESAVGLYGYMSLPASIETYAMQALVLLAVVVLMGVLVVRRADRKAALLVAGALACCLAGIAASIHHSWTFDFQPQGRYLFPLLPIVLIAWRRIIGDYRSVAVAALVPVAWAVSAYSFVGTCLAAIPK